MRKRSVILGSAVFFVVAPGTVVGLVPWWLTHWQMEPAFFGVEATRIFGAVLIAAGLLFLLDSFTRFALKGLGTPAPIAPPEHLVVSGYYRYVRNPMYVALLAILLGEAFLFGATMLVAYAAIMWFSFAVFVMGYEEPTLRGQFGAEYENYCVHVPRWIPRLTPWSI